MESVTVHVAVPEKSLPGNIVALKAVAAVVGDVIVMLAPPTVNAHEKVYGGIPPVTDTVVTGVVRVAGAAPLLETEAGLATGVTLLVNIRRVTPPESDTRPRRINLTVPPESDANILFVSLATPPDSAKVRAAISKTARLCQADLKGCRQGRPVLLHQA